MVTQLPGSYSSSQRSPLTVEEKVRAEANFVPLVAQALVARGRFQVTADTLELIEIFQHVALTVGSVLQRPVVSYANGEEIVITFDPAEPSGLAGERRS